MNEKVRLQKGKRLYGNSMMRGTPKPVPPDVVSSTFGCINCLWNGVECKSGSMYKEKVEGRKKFCEAYTYYD